MVTDISLRWVLFDTWGHQKKKCVQWVFSELNSVPWSETFGKGCSNCILGRLMLRILSPLSRPAVRQLVSFDNTDTQNWNLEFRRKENVIKQTKCGTRFENLPSHYERVCAKAIKATLRPKCCKYAGYSVLSFTFHIHEMQFFFKICVK